MAGDFKLDSVLITITEILGPANYTESTLLMLYKRHNKAWQMAHMLITDITKRVVVEHFCYPSLEADRCKF